MGVCMPEELGGRGRRLRLVRPRPRGTVPRRRGRRGHGRGPHERCDAADRRVRHRGAEARDSSRHLRAARRSAPSRSRSRVRARTRALSGRPPSRTATAGASTGAKQWCTNGSHASTFLLFARTDPATEGASRRLRVRARRRPRRGDARGGEARTSLVVDGRPSSRRRARRRRPAPPRGAQGVRGRDGDARRRAGSASLRRRSGSRRPRSTPRARTRSSASSSERRSPSSRRSGSGSPTWRPRSPPRAS